MPMAVTLILLHVPLRCRLNQLLPSLVRQPFARVLLLKLNFNGAQLYYVDNGDALPSNVYSESMTSARTHYYQIVGVDMLTTGARCASEPISVNVEVKENPEISLVSGGRTSICEGEQLSLKVAGALYFGILLIMILPRMCSRYS